MENINIVISNNEIEKIISDNSFDNEKKRKFITSSHFNIDKDMILDLYNYRLSKNKFKEIVSGRENQTSIEVFDKFLKNLNQIGESFFDENGVLKNGHKPRQTQNIFSALFNNINRVIYLFYLRDNEDNENIFEINDESLLTKFGLFEIEFNENENITFVKSNKDTYSFEGNIFSLNDSEKTKQFLYMKNGEISFIDSDNYFSQIKDTLKLDGKSDFTVANFKKIKSKKINENKEILEFIDFKGEKYQTYKYQKKSIEFISNLVEKLKEIENNIMKINFSINGHVNIGGNIDKELLEKIVDFNSNYFDDNKKEILDNQYVFDENSIQKLKVISHTLKYLIENESNKEHLRGERIYDTFKESIIESIDLIRKLLVASEIYLDEELNKEISVNNLIPKNNEFSLNEGFSKLLTILLDSYKYRRNTILIGHAGFGKTFGCKISCQLLGLPYYKFSCNAQTQIEEFFGSISQNEQGVVIREKGPLTKAIESGGLFVFDEFNSMPSETIKSLNAILDSIQGYEDGEKITIQISGKDFQLKVNKDLRICLTGNPSDFTEDYGILSRVTNDLSRRSIVVNTTNLFSGKEYNDSFIHEFILNFSIENEIEENEIEFRTKLLNSLKEISKEIQLAVGRGSISLKEDNRFFVMIDKEVKVDSTDSEIFNNVVIPVSSIFCLPLKNLVNGEIGTIKNAEYILDKYFDKHIVNLFDMNSSIEKQTFEKIKSKVMLNVI